MLVRICLIVAVLAGLAVGVLNFLQVKEKITVLQADLERETALHHEFEGKYQTTRKELDVCSKELKNTKDELATTVAARDKAEADLQA